jgi:ketosteroid isomerase-like protein
VTSPRVAVVERVFELFNQLPTDPQERTGSAAETELMELFDPNVEFTQPSVQVDAQTYIGRDALLASWDDWLTTWQEHRSEPEEVVERGDRVLVLSHDRLRARDGLEVDNHGASIFTFRDNKVTRFDAYFGHDVGRQAFEAITS